MLLLSGCFNGGILQMSDEWCDAHPDASPHRCVNHVSHYLPHRPMSEIDLQGHQDLLPHSADECLAWYNAPNGNLQVCTPAF